MVSPPEAEPVRAARILVATASDTSGPPSIPSTQSRTTAKAGSAATTAPNPTRLATLNTGRTAALAPASMLSRNAGKRCQFATTTVTIAASSATITAQTPPTAESDVSPQRGSARNATSSLGRTTKDISRFTAITTISGAAANIMGGGAGTRRPWTISAGSKA